MLVQGHSNVKLMEVKLKVVFLCRFSSPKYAYLLHKMNSHRPNGVCDWGGGGGIYSRETACVLLPQQKPQLLCPRDCVNVIIQGDNLLLSWSYIPVLILIVLKLPWHLTYILI